MRKFINQPDAFVDDMLEGLTLAYSRRLYRLESEPRAIISTAANFDGRVTIATGGGTGHLPLFVGYVGRGLADGCSVGNLFASPSADQMLAVTRAIDGGAGVLYLYGNYGGDRLNFNLAAEFAAEEGIRVETVRAADDVASAPPDRASDRRGVAGIYFGYRIAGACAAAGASLDEVAATTQRALQRTRSMGVALSSCILPTVGRPNFEVPEGAMEIGMGLHGEPGTRQGDLAKAEGVAEELVHHILDDLDLAAPSELAVLVNGLGATPCEELLILYRTVRRLLTAGGHEVRNVYVGEFATSLEMTGASLSVMHLDDELRGYLDVDADPPITMTG